MEVSSGQAGQHEQDTPVALESAHREHVGQQVPPGLLLARRPGPGFSEEPASAGIRASSSHVTPTPQGHGGPKTRPPSNPAEEASQEVTSGDSECLVTVTVQCALTLSLTAPRGADLSSLRALMSQALPAHAQRAQLSYQDPSEDRRWVPLSGEEALRKAWQDAAGPGGLQLQCRGVGGRPVLYQVVAQHVYSAQRPEDLALQPGDIVDVLCEVDQAWLEGHCDGRVGIFPKSFVGPVVRHA